MHARELLDRGERRLGALEAGECLVLQRRQDGTQAVGALGMVRAGLVAEAGGMGEEKGHVRPPLWDEVCRKGRG